MVPALLAEVHQSRVLLRRTRAPPRFNTKRAEINHSSFVLIFFLDAAPSIWKFLQRSSLFRRAGLDILSYERLAACEELALIQLCLLAFIKIHCSPIIPINRGIPSLAETSKTRKKFKKGRKGLAQQRKTEAFKTQAANNLLVYRSCDQQQFQSCREGKYDAEHDPLPSKGTRKASCMLVIIGPSDLQVQWNAPDHEYRHRSLKENPFIEKDIKAVKNKKRHLLDCKCPHDLSLILMKLLFHQRKRRKKGVWNDQTAFFQKPQKPTADFKFLTKRHVKESRCLKDAMERGGANHKTHYCNKLFFRREGEVFGSIRMFWLSKSQQNKQRKR